VNLGVHLDHAAEVPLLEVVAGLPPLWRWKPIWMAYRAVPPIMQLADIMPAVSR
jgi:hypothetical protein